MKNNFEYVGDMKFDGFVDISDPCYSRDGFTNIIDYPIKSGKYGCYIRYGEEESWNRIAEIAIMKKGYGTELESGIWNEICCIGVDSGMAGFFNHKIEYDNEEWDDFCDRIDYNKKWQLNFDNGFFSDSGWGDGGYMAYYYENEKDEIVGLKIVFID